MTARGDGAGPTSRPFDPASTADLVERARRGDRAAVDALFVRHYPPLRRWASGRLPRWARDLSDTDDLVQEALLQTFRKIDGFEVRGAGALLAYLRQAVLNRIRDQLRRQRRRPPFTELTAGAADDGPSALDQAIGRDALDRYERALARLRADEQAALIGRIELGYTYEELAEHLGKPTSEAARKAAGRALMRLVQEMERAAGDTVD
jgi:RNA polymerase sigma-70 factor (ECF subfamily)